MLVSRPFEVGIQTPQQDEATRGLMCPPVCPLSVPAPLRRSPGGHPVPRVRSLPVPLLPRLRLRSVRAGGDLTAPPGDASCPCPRSTDETRGRSRCQNTDAEALRRLPRKRRHLTLGADSSGVWLLASGGLLGDTGMAGVLPAPPHAVNQQGTFNGCWQVSAVTRTRGEPPEKLVCDGSPAGRLAGVFVM